MKFLLLKNILLLIILGFGLSSVAVAQDWNSNPNNWKNSPNNWENSSHRYGNERIIRDNDVNSTGYAVPKEDGGVNFYDDDGDRQGYLPSSE